jgi:hypothetical protein
MAVVMSFDEIGQQLQPAGRGDDLMAGGEYCLCEGATKAARASCDKPDFRYKIFSKLLSVTPRGALSS